MGKSGGHQSTLLPTKPPMNRDPLQLQLSRFMVQQKMVCSILQSLSVAFKYVQGSSDHPFMNVA
jgi:hypothetical protein